MDNASPSSLLVLVRLLGFIDISLQRRCIHDEHGNVDPVKAAETPMMRGSHPSKRRSRGEDDSPLPAQKKQRTSDGSSVFDPQLQNGNGSPHIKGFGILQPQPVKSGPPFEDTFVGDLPQNHTSTNGNGFTPDPSQNQHQQQQTHQQQQQPDLDPNLFTMYTHANNDFPPTVTDRPQPALPQESAAYAFPSLEQIANEVLVDMTVPATDQQPPPPQQDPATLNQPSAGDSQAANGGQADGQAAAAGEASVESPLPNGNTKTEESVDSAVSIPTTEQLEKTGVLAEQRVGHEAGEGDVEASLKVNGGVANGN